MITTMWTDAPAGFLRPRGLDVRPLAAVRGGGAVGTVAPVAGVQGTGVPVSGSAAICDPKFTTLAHTYGTTLGLPSSRRPSS